MGHNDSKKNSRRTRPATGAGALEVIDPVDRFIAKLYRSALSVSHHDYREWALREWRKVIPHDAALWGSGLMTRRRFHTVTLADLPADYPQSLEATTHINPMLPRILKNLDMPTDMRDVCPDREFFRSEIYRRVFEPLGISRLLSTSHYDARSGIGTLVTIYRRDRRAVFTDSERLRQQRLAYHLHHAASHAFFLHLARTNERPAGSAAAVVDREGLFYEAQPRFLDLLDAHFPPRAGQSLPFALPAAGETVVVGSVCIKVEPASDMFIVYLWPAGPLDRLTAREREIVNAVAQGLSFKQAAKKIGVAPSTVANHLYRVYRKLGVCSRTELAALVYPNP